MRLRDGRLRLRDGRLLGYAERGTPGGRPVLDFHGNFLAFAHHAKLTLSERKALFVAMAEDISWDGQPIAGMSKSDAELLGELSRSSPA